jgi:hypothetical protein
MEWNDVETHDALCNLWYIYKIYSPKIFTTNEEPIENNNS